MARLAIETGSGDTIVTIGDTTINLTELRRRAALAGTETKPRQFILKHKPGEGQMKRNPGSYLTEAEVDEERFNIEMGIA